MLLLDLSRLVGGRLRQTFHLAPGNPILGGYPAELKEPIELQVELMNPSHGTYVMTAELSGEAVEPCRRCLTPVEVEVRDRFRVVYQERGRDGEEEEAGDEDIVMIDAGANRIDIEKEVRDRLFIETDQFALCTEACKGICPACGANRNTTPCNCVVESNDHRWQALASLRRMSGE